MGRLGVVVFLAFCLTVSALAALSAVEGAKVWTPAQTCCKGCSYKSSCCCAPRASKATRTIRKSHTVTVTVNGIIKPRSLLASSPLDLSIEFIDDEPVMNQDFMSERAGDSKHLCPACPAGVALSSKPKAGASYCCPARQTVTKTIHTTATVSMCAKTGVATTKTQIQTQIQLRTQTVTVTTTSTSISTTVSISIQRLVSGRLFDDVNGDGVYTNPPDKPVANATIYVVHYTNSTSGGTSATPAPVVRLLNKRAVCPSIASSQTKEDGSFGIGVGVDAFIPGSFAAVTIDDPCNVPSLIMQVSSDGSLPATIPVPLPLKTSTLTRTASKTASTTTTNTKTKSMTPTTTPTTTSETATQTETSSSLTTETTNTPTTSVTKTTTATIPVQPWLDCLISGDGTVIAATLDNNDNAGFKVSNDSGATFYSFGTTGQQYVHVSMSRNGQAILVAQRSGYTWASNDFGGSFLTRGNTYPTPIHPYAVAVSKDGSFMAIGQNLNNVRYPFTSTDHGDTWTPQTAAAQAVNAYAMASCTPNGTVLVMVGENLADPGWYLAYKSTDSGATWSVVNSQTYRKWYTVICSQNGQKIVLGGSRISYSTDGGSSWTESSANGYDIIATGAEFQSLVAVDDNLSTILGAAGGSSGSARGLYKSTDLGENWTKLGGSWEDYWVGAGVSSDGNTIIGCINQGNVVRSTDGGATFLPIL